MSDITLSKAVRSNLLNLQNTADLLGKTQERLATGKRVNSALDNPINFFTASALNARASDMSSLLDSMANGVQTLEAADNGLTAITKTLESMQSTLTQARQDKSFKTDTFTMPDAGFTAGDTIGFSGGAFDTAPADLNLTKETAGTSTADFTAFQVGAATSGVNSFAYDNTAEGTSWAAGDEVDFTINIDGGGDVALTITQADVLAAGNGDDAIDSIDELQEIITSVIDTEGTYTSGNDYTITNDGTNISITSASTGSTSSVVISGVDGDPDAGDLDDTFGLADDNGTDGFDADTITFDIAVDGGGATGVTITAAQVAAVGNGDQTVDTLDEYQAVVEAALTAAGVTGVTVSQNDDGDALVFTSDTVGTDSSVEITNGAGNDGGAGVVDVADAGLDAPTEVAGAADGGDIKTVDELVSEINDSTGPYAGYVRASNDNGKLRIENLSTQVLTVDGIDTAGTAIDGGSGTATIEGNQVRADLVTQYNELRDQLDKLADDASFNGVNLLRGDNLRLTFNETGTSSIDIQTRIDGVAGQSINSATLGIQTNLEAADFDSDAGIDGFISEIKSALGTVRSQSSAFGSNLSIVENRQNFTKEMINTLETGASNLTLADTNEEAANLLALQTRQQLSSTALSLASQADQNVLRLF